MCLIANSNYVFTYCVCVSSNSRPSIFLSTQCHLNVDVNNIQEFTLSNLASLPAKMLRLQLKRYKLSPIGNKTTIANRLYQFLHPAVSSNITPTGLEQPPTAVETSHTTPSTINVPRQIMEQLSLFFQQFNNAIPITSMDTAGNNPPSAGDTTHDIDDSLSVASNQPAAPISQHLSIAYTTSNPAVTATVPTFSQATTTQPFTSTSVPALGQPTANQLLMSTSAPLFAQHIANQTSSPPVPPRIQDRIVRGEFVDFASLLPKAMFSGALEPETGRSLTVQLAPSGDDVSIQLASNVRKITSFSSWMEAWNIYLSIVIEHTPARATEFVAYQCIITSASIQYPTAAWLNYDTQFCTLAALNPSLRWDVRHTDLWLQFMTAAKPPQSARWPCKHCGDTNHYPDNCPFRPNHLLAIPGGQRAITREQPNSGSQMPPYPNQQKLFTCRDFNRSTCLCADCKFAHCCEHCGANHAGKNCRRHGWPSHTP